MSKLKYRHCIEISKYTKIINYLYLAKRSNKHSKRISAPTVCEAYCSETQSYNQVGNEAPYALVFSCLRIPNLWRIFPATLPC